MQAIQARPADVQKQPLYPFQPLNFSKVNGDMVYSYGRLFARNDAGHWCQVVDAADGTDD